MSFACALKIPLNGWIQKHWYTLMHLFFCIILNPICDVQYDKILESMKLLGLPLRGFWEPWRLGLTIKNPKGTFDSEMLMNSTCMYPSGWNSHTLNVFWQRGALFMVHMLQFPFSLSQSTWDMLLRNQADSSLEHRENIQNMYSRPSRQCSASPLRFADTCAQTLTLIARCLHDSSKGPYELLWLLLAGLQNKNELFLACGQSRQFMVC